MNKKPKRSTIDLHNGDWIVLLVLLSIYCLGGRVFLGYAAVFFTALAILGAVDE